MFLQGWFFYRGAHLLWLALIRNLWVVMPPPKKMLNIFNGKKEWFSFSFVINYQIRTCANRNKLLHFMNHFLNKHTTPPQKKKTEFKLNISCIWGRAGPNYISSTKRSTRKNSEWHQEDCRIGSSSSIIVTPIL